MVQKKKSDEQDVLVVRDEKTGEISVVAGLSRDGTPKRAPAKAENTPDFLRFDRNSDLMDSFFRNFYRQCKEPSRFGFYRIAADQVENLLGVMKELLKDPEANKEILSAHKVDTSNYEKEAKQSEGQAKETASSDDASKTQANTEKENVSSEQTNEKKNDMEQKPEQTATEQQAQTAAGSKQNLIGNDDVNLQELGAKYGIDFNNMNEKDMKALLNYGKTGLVIVKPTFGGEQIEIQARLSFRKDDNDQLQLVPHFVRNEPKLDVAYKGYTFTPEDKPATLPQSRSASLQAAGTEDLLYGGRREAIYQEQREGFQSGECGALYDSHSPKIQITKVFTIKNLQLWYKRKRVMNRTCW